MISVYMISAHMIYVFIICIFLVILFYLFIYLFSHKYDQYRENALHEGFYNDQTIIPPLHWKKITWDFNSLKSGIKDFNHSSMIGDLNDVKGNTSRKITHKQPIIPSIYTYTYINREFSHLLMHILNRIEKDLANSGEPPNPSHISNIKMDEYIPTKIESVPLSIRSGIDKTISLINDKFNIVPPIIGYNGDTIRIHDGDPTETSIIITIYKKYSACDIKYLEDIDPDINKHLHSKFETDILLIFDKNSATLKHLKIVPIHEEDKYKEWYDTTSFQNRQLGQMFYLSDSKTDTFKIPTNLEARNQYIKQTKDKIIQFDDYKCFNPKSFGQRSLYRVDRKTSCHLANGNWEQKCHKNEDCPYFDKSISSKNGGCNTFTGFCKFPKGVIPSTYRKPANPEDAYAYNCPNGILGKNTIGKCHKDVSSKSQYIFDDVMK